MRNVESAAKQHSSAGIHIMQREKSVIVEVDKGFEHLLESTTTTSARAGSQNQLGPQGERV